MSIAQLRRAYHRNICARILAEKKGVPNIADTGNKASIQIARGIIRRLGYPLAPQAPPGQRAGILFEQITRDFLQQAFDLLRHLRPGDWLFSVNQSISEFDQYEHLADLQRMLKENADLAAALV